MIKTFIIATAILTCTTVALSQPTEDSGPTYSMVMEYRGDAYVIDHGMSFGDCFDALPRNDARKGLSFACELEA